MNRRRFVAACLGAPSAALAGCIDFGGRSQDELPGVSLRLVPIRHDGDATTVAILEDELSAPQRHLVESALDGSGRSEAVTYGHEPFDVDETPSENEAYGDREYVEWDDAFYRVEKRETGTERVSRMVLRAEEVEADEVSDPVEPTTYPAPDQDRIDFAIRREMRRLRVDEEQRREIPELEWLYVFPERAAIEDHSDLVPEPAYEFVTAHDRHFRLVVQERTFVADEYAWTVTEVADDRNDFRRYVEDELLAGSFDDPPLSEEEAAIVDEAVGDGHSEYRPYSEAFVSLAERVDVTVNDGDGYETLGGPTILAVLVRYESRYWVARFGVLEY